MAGRTAAVRRPGRFRRPSAQPDLVQASQGAAGRARHRAGARRAKPHRSVLDRSPRADQEPGHSLQRGAGWPVQPVQAWAVGGGSAQARSGCGAADPGRAHQLVAQPAWPRHRAPAGGTGLCGAVRQHHCGFLRRYRQDRLLRLQPARGSGRLRLPHRQAGWRAGTHRWGSAEGAGRPGQRQRLDPAGDGRGGRYPGRRPGPHHAAESLQERGGAGGHARRPPARRRGRDPLPRLAGSADRRRLLRGHGRRHPGRPAGSLPPRAGTLYRAELRYHLGAGPQRRHVPLPPWQRHTAPLRSGQPLSGGLRRSVSGRHHRYHPHHQGGRGDRRT